MKATVDDDISATDLIKTIFYTYYCVYCIAYFAGVNLEIRNL